MWHRWHWPALVLLTACKVPDTEFSKAPDAGGPGDTEAGPDEFCNDKDLVACYEFEKSTTVLKDSSSNGNDGIMVGVTQALGHDGKANAIHVDGMSHIEINSRTGTLDVARVTIETWAKLDTNVAAAGIMTLINSEQKYAANLLPSSSGASNILQCHFKTATGQEVNSMSTSSMAIAARRWTHIACTYSYDSNYGYSHGYIDGQMIPIDPPAPPTPHDRIESAGPLDTNLNQVDPNIGTDSPCTPNKCDYKFSGAIEGLRIWNRERSVNEICTDAVPNCTPP